MGRTREVLSASGTKLAAAADRARETRAAYEAARDERNRLVVEAVDAGMPQRTAAALVGCAPSHIVRILSDSQRDLVLPR